MYKMISIILSILLLFLLYITIVKPYSFWINKGVKQGKQVCLLGDFAGIALNQESFCDLIIRLYNSFPTDRYVGIYQTLMPILIVKDIDLIKEIGVKEFEHFVDHRSFVPDGVDRLWSKNLFALKGAPWKKMRTTLSPNFTSSKMKIMFNLISECAEQYLEYFSKTNESKAVELKDIFTRYTNDVIATVAFGVKCDSMNQKSNDFYLMGRKATVFGFWRNTALLVSSTLPTLSKVLGLRFFPKSVTEFFENVIKDTIRVREEQGIVRPDMIHLLLEARKGRKMTEEQPGNDAGFATVQEVLNGSDLKGSYITDTDIAAQAIIFFFAGFETVSIQMCFMAYELALNPHIQKKLQQEIDDTRKSCEGKLTYDALVMMKYLDMVVTETLRKWPPIGAIDRVCTKSYTIQPKNPEEAPVILHPGNVIWLPVYAIHRDPKYYANPDKFDPERFSDENKDKIKPCTFFPFGLGPRNCIGSRMALLEVKTIFFHILEKFDFVVNEKTDIPLKLSSTSVNLQAQKAMWLDLKPRQT